MFSKSELILDYLQRAKLLSDFRYTMVDRPRGVQWKNEKQWMQITGRHKEQLLHLKSSQTGGWIARRACEISILKDIHNVTGKDHKQPDTISKLPPVRSRWSPLLLFYWHYFVVPWFWLLNGILNFSRYLHLALVNIEHFTYAETCTVLCLCMARVQGHLMEKA